MGKAFVIRYEMRPETADQNQGIIENVFAELAENNPEGVRYASFRLDDGVTFVHVGMIDEGSNGLAETAAFQEFQKGFGDRAAGAPDASGATLLGSFGFDR
ncbi:hypothetical protein AB0K51_01025 [Kitasatospora sp. NPDC049285]|uniref:hypothetical protein n=1 Tax=Kitasatospora sp. NPDC049285 TaxID=3157096 RepID=UPI00344961DD